jgi:hypothetical protein
VIERPYVFPNPCNPGYDDMGLAFNLGQPAVSVKLSVYSVAFRKIRQLELGACASGNNKITVPKENIQSLAPGIYYFVIVSENAGGSQARSKTGIFIIAR